jgi:ferredoxin--NADP+ reductase
MNLPPCWGENYIRCCTAETDEGVYPGRVTQFLEEQAGLDPAIKYYLCGSAEMVVEARDILISKGIPFEHIISEIYF